MPRSPRPPAHHRRAPSGMPSRTPPARGTGCIRAAIGVMTKRGGTGPDNRFRARIRWPVNSSRDDGGEAPSSFSGWGCGGRSRQPVQGRQDLRTGAGERGDILGEIVQITDMSHDDQQAGGGMGPERRRDQGGGRPPGPVDRRASAVLQRREDLWEARRPLDETGQVFQIADRGGLRRGGVRHGTVRRLHRPNKPVRRDQAPN